MTLEKEKIDQLVGQEVYYYGSRNSALIIDDIRNISDGYTIAYLSNGAIINIVLLYNKDGVPIIE